MANVSHASLTGSQLHEPKGVTSAALGTVYVANGSGSGSWADVGTASFTGMVADFVAPVAPSGWLECDGTVISTTTFSSLYAVMSIQSTGTRTNASPTVTSIASTTNFRVGYFVFGTGIASGTTIVSIDSSTQITLSNNASSSGTSAIAVSPWLLNTGTIKLPDLTTAGKFRRSRTSATKVGDLQANQNLAHTHAVTGNTANTSNDHTHSFSGTTTVESAVHTHAYQTSGNNTITASNVTSPGGVIMGSAQVIQTGGQSVNHTHNYSGTTSGESADHNHAISLTSASQGGTEARPEAIVMITCVKT